MAEIEMVMIPAPNVVKIVNAVLDEPTKTRLKWMANALMTADKRYGSVPPSLMRHVAKTNVSARMAATAASSNVSAAQMTAAMASAVPTRMTPTVAGMTTAVPAPMSSAVATVLAVQGGRQQTTGDCEGKVQAPSPPANASLRRNPHRDDRPLTLFYSGVLRHASTPALSFTCSGSRELGLDAVRVEVMPEDKVTAIRQTGRWANHSHGGRSGE